MELHYQSTSPQLNVAFIVECLLTELSHDLFDNLAQEIFNAFPQSNLNGAALTRTLFLGNAAVAIVLEGLEVAEAYASGESVGQQLAGAFGAVLGGAVGGLIGAGLGLLISPFLGAGLIAAGVTIGLGIAGSALLGGFLENYYENLYEEVADLFPDDLPLPDWMDDLIDRFTPPRIDPLVIDLDGDGIELTALEGSGAYFDLDADGFAENTGWVAPDDGLLAVDLNGNGTIDDITELFGSETETGYEQLAAYDSNGDGVINSDDADFDKLLIWQDLNGDGVSDAGELSSLTDAGIAEISLATTATNTTVNGNQIVETATVTLANGTTTQSGEVLFELSQVNSTISPSNDTVVDSAVVVLPQLRGFGNVAGLHVSMSQDASLRLEVENLISATRGGDFTGFENAFDNFLFQWGDVSEDTMWLGEAFHLTARLLYDLDDLDPNWEPNVNAPASAPPPVAGVIFVVSDAAPIIDDNFQLTSAEQEEEYLWLEERGLGIPATGEAPLSQKILVDGEAYVPPPSVVVGGGGSSVGISITDLGEDEDGDISVPDFDARQFAFIQNILGQDYSRNGNFRAPENVIIGNPPEDDIAEIRDSYDDLR